VSEFIDRLAELTALRDRDTLDVSLATALRDLIRPRRVAVHRVTGDTGDERWLTRARLNRDDITATADSIWSDAASLPPLASQPIWCRCLEEGNECVVPGEPVSTLLPMLGEGGGAGLVELVSEAPLSDELMRLAMGVMRIYRNMQSLLDYSERDTLTGLLNRKSFDETFYKVSATPRGAPPSRAPRGKRRAVDPPRFWLGLVDIDHFKQVNDRFGHLVGDEVLLLLSRVMRASFRFHDRLYRFGGEEFVVLLRCADEAGAWAALERLRMSVRQYPFPQVKCITVSIGFTDVRRGDTPHAAVERADRAVYHAKNHGRDQACSQAVLVARGLLGDDGRGSDMELF
jgi:diguanylate cyclase (GGDEF)-like protein